MLSLDSNKLSPETAYRIMNVMKTFSPEKRNTLTTFIKDINVSLETLNVNVSGFKKLQVFLNQEINNSVLKDKGQNNYSEVSSRVKDNFSHTVDGDENFVHVTYSVLKSIQNCLIKLTDILLNLEPDTLYVDENDSLLNRDFNKVLATIQLNGPSISKYSNALNELNGFIRSLTSETLNIHNFLYSYSRALQERHTRNGIVIYGNPILTDIALTIFENIDSQGELKDGKSVEEVSVYSLNRAKILIQLFGLDFMKLICSNPDKLVSTTCEHLKNTSRILKSVKQHFNSEIRTVCNSTNWYTKYSDASTDYEFEDAVEQIGEICFSDFRYRDGSSILSNEEKQLLRLKNEALEGIVLHLSKNSSTKEIIEFILNKKMEMETSSQEEGTFYVCRISSGNQFKGEAPGELKVLRSQKPNFSMDDVVGNGFKEVRTFFETIELSDKWTELFIATSPSGTADKSNVLLIGPQGSGKSQVMRSVSSDRNSVSIFAQGSDFLTCWMGEADKNPKRLFEAALKIQQDSKRHVHILIDEIDSVLNDDRSTSTKNLTLEFQILMDGIVNYPGISVWGATNNPERIPMPMLRRFSKVLVVGELDQKDRINLLKKFSSSLPTKNIKEEDWDSFAKRLDGAVGDCVRKIVDHIWREKVSDLIQSNPNAAKSLLSMLKSDGTKFSLKEFNGTKREEFLFILSKCMTIEPIDFEKSINLHLNNISFRGEIESAKETYSNARKLLMNMKNSVS